MKPLERYPVTCYEIWIDNTAEVDDGDPFRCLVGEGDLGTLDAMQEGDTVRLWPVGSPSFFWVTRTNEGLLYIPQRLTKELSAGHEDFIEGDAA